MNSIDKLRKFWLVILLLFPLAVFAQDDPKPTKKEKKADQKKEQRVQDSKRAEIKGQKKHMKLQEKQTRKRMKQHKKQGKAYVSRRPGFFQRLSKSFR